MTGEERKTVQRHLLVLSELYGRQLSTGAIILMSDALHDLDCQKVIAALTRYAADPTSRSFPLPGQIRHLVAPNPSDTENALEAVNRIIEGMAKYGWTQPDRAKQFIGDLGWLVVQREGGWQRVCETSNNDNLPTLKAQWRELAKALTVRSKAGVLSDGPSLPAPTTNNKLLEKKP